MAIEFLSLRSVVCACLTKLHISLNENSNLYSFHTVNTRPDMPMESVKKIFFYDVSVAISSKI